MSAVTLTILILGLLSALLHMTLPGGSQVGQSCAGMGRAGVKHGLGQRVQLLDVFLIAGDGAAFDAEDGEEVVVKAVGLAFLIGCVLPLFGEGGGTDANFVPG